MVARLRSEYTSSHGAYVGFLPARVPLRNPEEQRKICVRIPPGLKILDMAELLKKSAP